MQRIICVLVVQATPLLLRADNDDVKKEMKLLEGKWKAVGLEVMGNASPKDQVPPFNIVIGADGKSKGDFMGNELQFTMTIDPKKNPKTIDNFHEAGDQKGKKQYGIYKLDGDKFTVCISRPGAMESDRPKEFTTKDSANVIFTFERVKEEKKP